MNIVLAALDTTSAARAVLECAVRTAELSGSGVEMVHVTGGPTESATTPEELAELAARRGLPFRVLVDPVEPALFAASSDPRVIAVVIGARATPVGPRPVGANARRILEHAEKPVVVVPPEAVTPAAFRRLLLPLEGTETSSRPVLDRLLPLLVADVELEVLHVFTEVTLPAMLDRPGRDLDILGREFLTRHCPGASRIELRAGPVAARVAEVSKEHGADLVVLSWSQHRSQVRARIVREVLGASTLPVLLLPIEPDGSDRPGGPDGSGGPGGPGERREAAASEGPPPPAT